MVTKNRKKIILFTIIAALVLPLIIWTAWGNTALELNLYTISDEKLPEVFDGYRIAHVSDLHNTEIGKNNEKLLLMLYEAEPDIIAITGDLIDSRKTDIQVALHFAKEAAQIAPCYYVTGNHESRISEYGDFNKKLTELGVTVLDDESVVIERSGESIVLIGINDPSFYTDHLSNDADAVDAKLKEVDRQEGTFTMLLSHRPELFDVYAKNNMDLVLSGHVHGGQFRLPFVGGLAAPNQGLFPKYDAGLYTDKNTNMIVSRGIGNSIFPFRFNNRPEVILIELDNEK